MFLYFFMFDTNLFLYICNEVMIKAQTYKLYPKKEQLSILAQMLGVCRLIYNLCLEYKIMMWKEHGISVSKSQLQKEIKEISKEYDWIRKVHSQVRQNPIHRMLKAYDNFWKQGMGFPKFAKKGKFKSFTYPQGFKFEKNYIYLPKVGWVKYRKYRSLPKDAEINSVTVRQEADGWHISVNFETKPPEKKLFDDNQAIGLDVGIKYYYVSSDGVFVGNPNFIGKYAAKIRRQQRKLARQKKGGRNREKTKQALSKTHLKLSRARKDYTHKLTTNIVRDYSIIVVENLNLKGMTRSAKGTKEKHGKNVKAKSGLNKKLIDLGIGEFFRQLEYKAKWYGREFHKVRPHYSSQECSECGHTSKENRLTQSQFRCVSCGHQANADWDAAKVILGRGLSFRCQREVLTCA